MEIHTIHPDRDLTPDFWRFPEPAPLQLHVRGSRAALRLLERLPGRGFAVVGTRDPKAASIAEAGRILAALRGADLVIVSGLALGIDAAAHDAALANGLPTVAVLASGVDRIHPAANAGLAERILRAGGLIVSEYDPGELAYPSRFLERNRLIAGLARATWIVEASRRSGSLNTARWARDNHREVYSTPCRPGDTLLAGNQALLDDHHAIPLWGPHSLGQSWPELSARPEADEPSTPRFRAARSKQGRSEPPAGHAALAASILPFLREDARALLRAIDDPEGIHPLELLERQMSNGWTPGRYHLALHEALQAGALLERKGLLLKIPDLAL